MIMTAFNAIFFSGEPLNHPLINLVVLSIKHLLLLPVGKNSRSNKQSFHRWMIHSRQIVYFYILPFIRSCFYNFVWFVRRFRFRWFRLYICLAIKSFAKMLIFCQKTRPTYITAWEIFFCKNHAENEVGRPDPDIFFLDIQPKQTL